MQLYSTTKKPLNERFTKIMKQRKKLKIFEEIEIQVNDCMVIRIYQIRGSYLIKRQPTQFQPRKIHFLGRFSEYRFSASIRAL